MAPNTSKYNNKLKMKDIILAELKLLRDDLNNGLSDHPLLELERRKDKITNSWHNFVKAHNDATDLCERPENYATMSVSYDEAWTLSKTGLALLEEEIKKKKPAAAPSVAEIKLEKYTGLSTEWAQWKAVFEERVMKADLKPGQKVDLLLGALEGAAKDTAGRAEKRDEEELQRIWGRLIDNFENKYQQVLAHLFDIMAIPNIESPCEERFRNLVNQIEEHQRLLLRYDVTLGSEFLCATVMNKLDVSTLYLWNTKTDKSDLPKSEELFKFLKSRSQALENGKLAGKSRAKNVEQAVPPCAKVVEQTVTTQAKDVKGSDSNSDKSSNATKKPYTRSQNNSNNYACLCCDEKGHSIFRCTLFLAMTVKQRTEFVESKQCCTRCIRQHPLNQCNRFFKCQHCNSPEHNTILCYMQTGAHEAKPRLN